ncbi:MAG: aminoacyl-tRNA hydrolase [Myxococcales bacterium]|nr:aminoacyl-tRNA hydrolase [Myxococcales bacterium]
MGAADLQVDGRRAVPGTALIVKTSRSSGPGGQHVNKTDSRVTLELILAKLEGVWTEVDRARVHQRLRSQLTSDGRLIVHADGHRHQRRNLEDARSRMASVLRNALFVPKLRRPTQPSKGSKRRRLESKRRAGEKKQSRRKVEY